MKLCGWNLARRTQKHNHRRRKAHAQPQVQLLNCVILPPCHSLWLICNNWPSSSPPTQMDSRIDYTQSKKKRKRKKKIQLSSTKHSAPIIAPRYHSLCNPSYVFVHAPLWRICYWSAICVYVFVHFSVCECVCVFAGAGQPWASVFTCRSCSYWLCSGGAISGLCWRSINPDRSIVAPLFTAPDQPLTPRYHFQLEKHLWADEGGFGKTAAD